MCEKLLAYWRGLLGWCEIEALYATLDDSGDIAFWLRGNYELKDELADIESEGEGQWVRVSKDRKEDEISGINPQTKELITLGGGIVAEVGNEDSKLPCYSKNHVREEDVPVDHLRNGGELVWAE